MINTQYTTVIGLEIHAALLTKTKLFSRAENTDSCETGAENSVQLDENLLKVNENCSGPNMKKNVLGENSLKPNTHVDLLDVGMPGALPVLNFEAVVKAVRAALALNMKINEQFSFDRKHYFYPDSPQGYQLTQFYKPIGVHGYLDVGKDQKRIKIKQVHIETDAGKSMHVGQETLLDYNRCGCPLIEIVTDPDISNAEEAISFLQLLRSTLRYTGACDCSMENGNFRVDVSISVILKGQQSKRVEVKNLNSYRAIRKAIEFESKRHLELLSNGTETQQECRLFNGSETVFMRSKESARDYMYLPEPDLPTFQLQEDMVSVQADHLDLLPAKLIKHLQEEFLLSYEDAFNLVEEREIYLFLAEAIEGSEKTIQETVIKLMRRCVFRKLNEGFLLDITPLELREIAECAVKYNLNGLLTDRLFKEVWNNETTIPEFVSREGLDNLASTDDITEAIEVAFNAKPMELEKFLNGETRFQGLFMGLVMKHFANKVDPKVLNVLINKSIENRRLQLLKEKTT